MKITDYYTEQDGKLSFSRQQASDFAKLVAGDFNPIHDIEAKRFCVPGDLLFAVVLQRYGLAAKTTVGFEGMVNDSAVITLPDVGRSLVLEDASARQYLQVKFDQEPSNNPEFIAKLTELYVTFSGQTFPDILVPLMQSANVMINPARPLVIYKDMQVELDQLDGADLSLSLDSTSLDVDGKKGVALLEFVITSENAVIGRGQKTMVLGGLREYNQSDIDGIVADYMTRKRELGPNAGEAK